MLTFCAGGNFSFRNYYLFPIDINGGQYGGKTTIEKKYGLGLSQ